MTNVNETVGEDGNQDGIVADASAWNLLDTIAKYKQVAIALTTIWPIVQKIIALAQLDSPAFIALFAELKDAIAVLFPAPVQGFAASAGFDRDDFELSLMEEGGDTWVNYKNMFLSHNGPDGHRIKWFVENVGPLLVKYGPILLTLI